MSYLNAVAIGVKTGWVWLNFWVDVHKELVKQSI